MDWNAYISADPTVLVGKPVVKGTRIAVEQVLDLLAAGWSETDLLENYPRLTSEAIRACLLYASDVIRTERVSLQPRESPVPR